MELQHQQRPDHSPYDGSMTPEQLKRALIIENRGIDLETAQELVYLRDRAITTYRDGHLDGLREAERLSCITGAIRERIKLAESEAGKIANERHTASSVAREIVLYMNQRSGHAEGDEWFGEGDVKAVDVIIARGRNK